MLSLRFLFVYNVLFLGGHFFWIVWFYIAYKRLTHRRHLLTHNLCVITRLNLPLYEAFKRKKRLPLHMRFVFSRIRKELERGASLASALGCRWACIPQWYARMVYIGEQNNILAHVFERIKEIDSNDDEWRMNLLERIIYPFFLAVSFTVIASAMLDFVIPDFSSMLAYSAETSQTMKFIKEMEQAVFIIKCITIGFAIIGVMLALFLIYILMAPVMSYLGCSADILVILSRFFKWWVPVIGTRYRKAACARWADCLSIFLETGESLHKAVRETAFIENDERFSGIVESWADDIEKGKTLGEVIENTTFVPRSLVWQVKAAEGGPGLPAALRQAARMEIYKLNEEFAIISRILSVTFVIIIGFGVSLYCTTFFKPLINSIYSCLE